MKKRLFKKINLQFFAEEPGTNNEPKTYTEEEYNKLKTSFDKTCSELSKLKKEKLTEEEVKAQEQKERENHIKDIEERLANSEIKEALLEGGVFTKEEVAKIIENKNDMKKLSTELSNMFKTKLEEEKKKWNQELIDKSQHPQTHSGSNNEDSLAAQYAKKHSQREDAQKVEWGSFEK